MSQMRLSNPVISAPELGTLVTIVFQILKPQHNLEMPKYSRQQIIQNAHLF